MPRGKPYSGPYGKIHDLELQIKDHEFEIRRIDVGHKRKFTRKQFEAMIRRKKASIKKIRQRIRAKKKK